MLPYIAAMLTLVALVAVVALLLVHRATRPALAVHGGQQDDAPGMVLDPDDTGVRVTTVEVASPFPLAFVKARYTLDLPDAGVSMSDVTHQEVVDALRAAKVDDATWGVTLWTPGAMFPPRTQREVFSLTLPNVRRLRVLEVELTFRDPAGRTLPKTVSALPKQPLGRPVSATERPQGHAA